MHKPKKLMSMLESRSIAQDSHMRIGFLARSLYINLRQKKVCIRERTNFGHSVVPLFSTVPAPSKLFEISVWFLASVCCWHCLHPPCLPLLGPLWHQLGVDTVDYTACLNSLALNRVSNCLGGPYYHVNRRFMGTVVWPNKNSQKCLGVSIELLNCKLCNNVWPLIFKL